MTNITIHILFFNHHYYWKNADQKVHLPHIEGGFNRISRYIYLILKMVSIGSEGTYFKLKILKWASIRSEGTFTLY